MAFKSTLIKCLICLGFLFVSSAITTGLAYAGVLLGGVPTVFVFRRRLLRRAFLLQSI